MRTRNGQPIQFPEWGYLGKGKFQRRDFSLKDLTHASAHSREGDIFSDHGKHELFMPIRTWPPMTVAELAAVSVHESPQATP